jgi:hypothetical protein
MRLVRMMKFTRAPAERESITRRKEKTKPAHAAHFFLSLPIMRIKNITALKAI